MEKNIHLLIIHVLFDSSVPTPALTDDITVNWEPLTPAKNQIYRIDLKQSMDAEHNLDRIKYVMEIIVVLLYEMYNIRIKLDIGQANLIFVLRFQVLAREHSKAIQKERKGAKEEGRIVERCCLYERS